MSLGRYKMLPYSAIFWEVTNRLVLEFFQFPYYLLHLLHALSHIFVKFAPFLSNPIWILQNFDKFYMAL